MLKRCHRYIFIAFFLEKILMQQIFLCPKFLISQSSFLIEMFCFQNFPITNFTRLGLGFVCIDLIDRLFHTELYAIPHITCSDIIYGANLRSHNDLNLNIRLDATSSGYLIRLLPECFSLLDELFFLSTGRRKGTNVLLYDTTKITH